MNKITPYELEITKRNPYTFYSSRLENKDSNLVELLDKVQKENPETITPKADISELRGGQFVIINPDYKIWVMGKQKKDYFEIMTKGDKPSREYLSNFFKMPE